MGWKNVKEWLETDYIVHSIDGNVLIGSQYVPNIITIHSNGKMKHDPYKSGARIEELKRIRSKIEKNQETVSELIKSPDTFGPLETVYTFDYEGNILEKQCEAIGYPNVTTEGAIQYENVFFSTGRAAIKGASEELFATFELATSKKDRLKDELIEAHEEVKRAFQALKNLKESAGRIFKDEINDFSGDSQ